MVLEMAMESIFAIVDTVALATRVEVAKAPHRPKARRTVASGLLNNPNRVIEDYNGAIVFAGYALAYAPPGTFEMGSPKSETDRRPNEVPHTVTLTRGFYVGTTEVTQELYYEVVGENPSVNYGRQLNCAACPVENVHWYAAVEFCNKLSALEGLEPAYAIEGLAVSPISGANGYRLPTEAEWEYAARAGESHTYSGSDDSNEVAWYAANSGGQTQPVATKKANAWGLYDMSGNVWEWVWDIYWDYPKESVVDPLGHPEGDHRVRRGGCFSHTPYWLRVALRSRIYPGNYDYARGFRIVRSE